jgi:hypothetical protein
MNGRQTVNALAHAHIPNNINVKAFRANNTDNLNNLDNLDNSMQGNRLPIGQNVGHSIDRVLALEEKSLLRR